MYVPFLADQKLKHGTIKVYLSAIRNLQIASGLSDPFAGAAMPQHNQVMKGIHVKWVEAERGIEKRKRLPITPATLLNLKKVWSGRMSDFDTKMIWAACCLCFFCVSSGRGDDGTGGR